MDRALAIANHFIALARKYKIRELPPVKLHGLVYFAHGWWLGLTGKHLLDNAVRAARAGVFVPELREAGCWGTRNTDGWLGFTKMDEGRGLMTEITPRLPHEDPAVRLLAWVWDIYGTLQAFEISQQIRAVGTPWDLIWNDEGRQENDSALIPNGTVRLWFQALSDRYRSEGRALPEVPEHAVRPQMSSTQPTLVTKPDDPNRLRKT